MIYFDNGATSFPKPKLVYDEIFSAMTEYGANPGRSGHEMAMKTNRKIYKARRSLAKLFNIKNPMDIVLTFNCTSALNLGIKGFLKEGDHVITTSMEHNSVLRPIVYLEKKGITNTIVMADSYGRVDPEDIRKAIRPETRLIVSTHMSNLTGTIIDIEEIGKIALENNIKFLVDGAQSAGAFDIDVEKMNIDMLAFPGHKSLLGPQGTGGLYIREGIVLEEIYQGGTGSLSDTLIQPDILPDKYESGTPNGPGLIGLGAGVEYILSQGIENIRKKEMELTKYFIEEIDKIENIRIYGPKDISERGPVVPINLTNKDSSELAFILDDKYNIGVRPGLHCAPMAHKTIGTFETGAVRFSFGYENTFEELDLAIRALREISKE